MWMILYDVTAWRRQMCDEAQSFCNEHIMQAYMLSGLNPYDIRRASALLETCVWACVCRGGPVAVARCATVPFTAAAAAAAASSCGPRYVVRRCNAAFNVTIVVRFVCVFFLAPTMLFLLPKSLSRERALAL